jgi:hypothetical protein
MGEVAAFAQVLTHVGSLKAIQEQVRFARAHFGHYDLIDFVAVLIGYALSGEPTLLAFYERLTPFAEPFMTLFGRSQLAHRSTLSRFLAALDQASVEALRALFNTICLRANRFLPPVACSTGGESNGWWSMWTERDKLPANVRFPKPSRCLRLSALRYCLCARISGTQARRSGAHPYGHSPGAYASVSGNFWWTGQWRLQMGTLACHPGDYQLCDKARASHRFRAASPRWTLWRCAPLLDVLTAGLGVIARSRDYGLLDLEMVKQALARSPDQVSTHPRSVG